jgi:ubiquinone/menaquinone biosynthesis C-methylase UbiE
MTTKVDVDELETKVKDMYKHVAESPEGKYHFEMGRPLADRLSYPADVLDSVPEAAVESFAGVGYFFDLAELKEGETVVDLGSGSGMDSFFASVQVGPEGKVIGVDFTAEQLAKSRKAAEQAGLGQAEFREGRLENLPVEDETCDCAISNGVINLVPDKAAVFSEVARVLKPGGRLALADIVSEQELKESIVCDADLWASCIGGAAQQDAYRAAIESAGLRIDDIRENPYEFISDQAKNASAKYGVKSVSLLAVKR